MSKLLNHWKSLSKNKKITIIIGSIFFILILTSLLGQLILYLNFIIGNDIVLKLSSNKEDFQLKNNEEDTLKLTIQADANPFCKLECSSNLIDISRNITIESEVFEFNPITPINKEFIIKPNTQGTGQLVYTYRLECAGIKSRFCNTKENPVQRRLLITIEHDLSVKEEEVKNFLLNQINAGNELVKNTTIWINATENVSLNHLTDPLKYDKQILVEDLIKLKEEFKKQDYLNLKPLDLITIQKNLNSLQNEVLDRKKEESIKEELKLKLRKDLLCEINNLCLPSPSINNLPEKLNDSVCININNLNDITQQLFNKEEYILQNYPNTEEFNNTIKLIINNKKQELINNYLDNTNNTFIHEILDYNAIENITLEEYNLTQALNLELSQEILTCESHVYNEIILEEINITKIIPDPSLPICCYKNSCTPCCIENTCQNDPNLYPIIFLHGHDFNKDLSALYSLNSFNSIEKQLEKNSYLPAGSISLSTPYDNQNWGLINVPLVVKGSYYFDILQYSNSTEILETKTENLDTYAIRLNDIIDILKYKTNKPKVTIIAHSMGGLIARRYVQIFGNESIDKLVLIATPNKGIEGSINTYCKLFGAELECRDMDKDSLFINKLNSKPISVNAFTIIGTGCTSDSQPSDGIVLEKNAKLNGTKEFIINGTCSGTNLLHNTVLDVSKYPEIYKIIIEILKNKL